MKTIETARHAAHASAHDHPGRFYSGLAVVALGTGLWLAEVARMLGGERLSDTTLAHAREMLLSSNTKPSR